MDISGTSTRSRPCTGHRHLNSGVSTWKKTEDVFTLVRSENRTQTLCLETKCEEIALVSGTKSSSYSFESFLICGLCHDGDQNNKDATVQDAHRLSVALQVS